MKKIKLNWGFGIVIVLILFLGTVVFRVIYSSNIAVDIVATDYYHKELNYSEQIEKKNNTFNLPTKVKCKKTKDSIIVNFPQLNNQNKIEGKILFYNPQKVEKDLEFNIELDSNLQQAFNLNTFSEPRYIIQINWQSGEKKYYQEFDVQL